MPPSLTFPGKEYAPNDREPNVIIHDSKGHSKFLLSYCYVCSKENHPLAIATGTCFFCGWSAGKPGGNEEEDVPDE